MLRWHQDIYNIISNAKQKGVLNFDSDKLQIFYRSIDRLIKNQTHEIAIQGMNDYVKIFAVNDQKIQKSQHYGNFKQNFSSQLINILKNKFPSFY